MSSAKFLAYTGVSGTNVHTELGHGRITFIHRKLGVNVGATIALDSGQMAYATLGAIYGGSDQWREIDAIRVITRDEFDTITGIADIRREMGWTA